MKWNCPACSTWNEFEEHIESVYPAYEIDVECSLCETKFKLRIIYDLIEEDDDA